MMEFPENSKEKANICMPNKKQLQLRGAVPRIQLKQFQQYNTEAVNPHFSVCTMYQIGIIVGLLLGDGRLNKPNPRYARRNSRLAVCMSADVLYYLNWVKYDLLKNLCTRTPPTGYPKSNPTQYWIGTRFLPLFTDLYKMCSLIKNGKKVKVLPDLSFLNIYLNEVSLAH